MKNVHEFALATLIAGLGILIVTKLKDGLVSSEIMGMLDWVGLSVELLAMVVFAAWKVRVGLTIIAVAAMISVFWHLVAPEAACNCVGFLDRMGGNAAILVASAGGLASVFLLAFYRHSESTSDGLQVQ